MATRANIITTSPSKLPLLLLILLPFLVVADINYNSRKHVEINEIDRCWRRDPHWADRRQDLAVCAVGFCGKMRRNIGKNVTFYEVTDSSDDSSKPRAGTLRYGVELPGKVWITFKRNMFIRLQEPLLISSYTTIDGRGAEVHITRGAGFLLRNVSNVIIHGLHFHEIFASSATNVVRKGGSLVHIGKEAGDAIRVMSGKRIWIDHNTFARASDGLVDLTLGTTKVTISNNWFQKHNKVMLFGHNDHFFLDRNMRVTVVYNRIGPECVQRMPRIRHGYVHVANNLYLRWYGYAIGGGMNPTILSQGNKFVANIDHKLIVWKESGDKFNVRSEGDAFVNEAYFTRAPGTAITNSINHTTPNYGPPSRFFVRSSDDVDLLTQEAGPLICRVGMLC